MRKSKKLPEWDCSIIAILLFESFCHRVVIAFLEHRQMQMVTVDDLCCQRHKWILSEASENIASPFFIEFYFLCRPRTSALRTLPLCPADLEIRPFVPHSNVPPKSLWQNPFTDDVQKWISVDSHRLSTAKLVRQMICRPATPCIVLSALPERHIPRKVPGATTSRICGDRRHRRVRARNWNSFIASR